MNIQSPSRPVALFLSKGSLRKAKLQVALSSLSPPKVTSADEERLHPTQPSNRFAPCLPWKAALLSALFAESRPYQQKRNFELCAQAASREVHSHSDELAHHPTQSELGATKIPSWKIAKLKKMQCTSLLDFFCSWNEGACLELSVTACLQ